MKRTLALFLVLVMVFSLVAVAVPAIAADELTEEEKAVILEGVKETATVQNTGKNSLDGGNVGITVPHFSGTLIWNETTGRAPGITVGEDTEITLNKEATSDAVIHLDGAVSEEEWGDPILVLDSHYAATKLNFSEPSAENTFYWWEDDPAKGANPEIGLNYKLWMTWDEDYLVFAAEVMDPDCWQLGAGGKDVWNGDSIQFRIDPQGPNSITNGVDYDPSVNRYPFASTYRSGGGEKYGGYVANIGVGYVDAGYIDIHDMSQRYNPWEEEVFAADGTLDYVNTAWRQGVSFAPNNPSFGGNGGVETDEIFDNPFGVSWGSYQAALTRTNPNNRMETKAVYEFAIPWAYFDGSYVKYDKETETSEVVYTGYVPTAGDEFGIAIALLNGLRGGSGYNSWLTWGAGICGAQVDGIYYNSSAGTNSMLLGSEELGAENCTHPSFAAASCIAAETCTVCGYQRGFSVGHDYTHEAIAAPTSTTDGQIVSTCGTCGDVVTTNIAAKDSVLLHEFVYDMTNTSRFTTSLLGDGELVPNFDHISNGGNWDSGAYNYQYFEKDSEGLATEVPVIDPRTNAQKNLLDVYGDKVVLDLTDDYAGTYFQTNGSYGSYSYEYSFRIDENGFYEDFIDPDASPSTYENGVYHQFGGTTPQLSGNVYGTGYIAGFFPTEKDGTSGVFRIATERYATFVPAEDGSLTDERGGELLNESEVIDLGYDWHKINFIFDDDSDTAMILLDGEVVAAAWDPGMDMNGNTQASIWRRFNVGCMISDMKIGNITAFTEAGEVGPTMYTVTCDGEVIGEYEAGVEVELPVPEFTDGERFYTWEGADVERGDFNRRGTTANKRTYTLIMPEEDVELTSDWVMVGDANGDGRNRVNDLSILKKIIAGDYDANDKQSEGADCNLDGKNSSTDLLAWKKNNSGSDSFTK